MPTLPSWLDPERGAGDVDLDRFVALREFHLLGRSEQLQSPADGTLPALLASLRGAEAVRTDYPLLLDRSDNPVRSLSEVLAAAVDQIAAGAGDARILRDNLVRLERMVLDELAGPAPGECVATARRASERLARELGLTGANADALGAQVAALLEALPGEGTLLPFSADAHLFLLAHLVECELTPRREAFYAELRGLAGQLRELLRVERDKSDDARGAEALGKSVGGTAQQFVDFSALSSVVGKHRGSQAMTAERRARIERALAMIEAGIEASRPLGVLLHEGPLGQGVALPAGWKRVQVPLACSAACEHFDAQTSSFVPLFLAARVARLELEQRYDAVRHDPWAAAFDWEAFSRDELQLLPAIVALTSDDTLAGDGMAALSGVLVSGRPVRVLAQVRPAKRPGAAASDDPLDGFRLELGYLGIGHREALVQQTSVARPTLFCEGLRRALGSTRASLVVISSGLAGDGSTPGLGAWLHAGAALEGRAHPFFYYDPEGGLTWARRFELTGNPELQADWPAYPFECRVDGGEQRSLELAFTFADFALLEPGYRGHFRVVPRECAASSDLVPIADYLSAKPEDAGRLIPCVWAVDEAGQLSRLAMSRGLAFACRDRLGFWRSLQELAGIRSEYIELAVAKAVEEVQAEAAAERERMQAVQTEELDRVRREMAGEAMQKLAASLMELDVGALGSLAAPSASPPVAIAPAAEAAAPAAEAPAAAPEPEPALSFDEPYIDTPLCTSCNDCINLNQLMFVYDGNKQARIADLNAGTYEQLVVAAEKCPAKCIHPGKPQNPDEPNLEALIARAAPFN